MHQIRRRKNEYTTKINYLILATLVITSVLLTSCGQPAAPDGDAPAVANPEDVTTLNVWGFEGEEGIFDALVKDFMMEHAGSPGQNR